MNYLMVLLFTLCAASTTLAKVSLPADKQSEEIIKTLTDSILRKFRTRLSDLQKTYSSKRLENSLFLIYRDSDSGCSLKNLSRETNLQISWAQREESGQLIESISYAACDEGEIVREVLVRSGPELKKMTAEDILSVKRPLALSADQTSFTYKLLSYDGIEQLSFSGMRDAQNQIRVAINIQGQKAFDLFETKTQDGHIRLQMQRYPFDVTFIMGRSRSQSKNGGFDLLFAHETAQGPVYLKDSAQQRISESEWNQIFNDNIAAVVGNFGGSMILEMLSGRFPVAKKVVLSGGGSEKMLKELIEIKDLVNSDRNKQRVEAVINDFIDAVGKGFIKDERP